MRTITITQGDDGKFTVAEDGQPPKTVASAEEALSAAGMLLGVQEEAEESDLGGPMPDNGSRPPVPDRSSQQAMWNEEAARA